MCGIGGFSGKKDFKKLHRLLLTMAHRGREGTSTYYDHGIHLGMNRLAINDLRSTPYPIKYKHYVLVFNGEIYNYRALKSQLEKKKIHFSTTCDAEVILPLFVFYGVKSFPMLEGMFAIAIFDTKEKRLTLARDKSGEKPLYYKHDTEGIRFASEIKTLVSFISKENSIDKEALRQYLSQGFVHSPKTLVAGIEKVPPSHVLIYDVVKREAIVQPYWHLPSIAHTSAGTIIRKLQNSSVSLLEDVLRTSVESRLLADVPIGAFLSGGIDSSLITLFAAQKTPGFKTYSVSFPGYERYDESFFAKKVALWIGTNHTEVFCTAKSVIPFIEDIGKLIDEPIVDPAVLPTILMAKEARKNVKVVLTGEGADELFGGYHRYQKQLLFETIRPFFLATPLAIMIAKRIFPNRSFHTLTHSLRNRYSPTVIWNNNQQAQLLTNPFTKTQVATAHGAAWSDPLLGMQLSDFRGYMAEQLLMKIDKSTMAENLEARAPYLDTHVIEFAMNLSTSEKLRWFQGKYILKQLASRYFPWWFVWRPKHGFSVPLHEWFRYELKPFVMESVGYLDKHTEYFNSSYYRQIIDDHMERRFDYSDKIWSMLVLSRWLIHHHVSL